MVVSVQSCHYGWDCRSLKPDKHNMKMWVLCKSVPKWLLKVVMYTNKKHCPLTGRNATNTELNRENQEMPLHLDLPTLSKILKMC